MTTGIKQKAGYLRKFIHLLLSGVILCTLGSSKIYAGEINPIRPDANQQQQRTVTGIVTDSHQIPLVGVSVTIEGTTTGATTGIDGRYSIRAQANQMLTFSYVGYETVRVQANRELINITLSEDAQLLDEVVIVGFGVQKKANLTGAVSTVDIGKTIESKPLVSVEKALQGVAPGLTINFQNGRLNADATIRLRGAGTIIDGVASGSPLVLVDGAPTDLTLVNPNDIESISVLKDASAASIYGTRAAFGVILITTKTGASDIGKVRFNYSTNFAYSKPSVLVDFVDAEYELPAMMAATMRSSGAISESFGMYHDKLLEGILKWKKNYAGSRSSKNKEMIYGEDWEIIDGRAYTYRLWDPHKEMLRDWTPQMTHNLTAEGKLSEKSNFLISLGYVDQAGFLRMKTEKFKRYNANLSLTTQLAPWLKSTVGFLFSRKDYKEPFNYYNTGSGMNNSGYNGYFGYYMRWGQYFPFGTYDGYYFRHAPGFLSQANYNNDQTDLMRISANLIADITKDIKLNVEYRFTTTSRNLDINGHPIEVLDFWSGGWDPNDILGTALGQAGTGNGAAADKVARMNSKNDNHVFNAYATFEKTFNTDHNLKVMAGINVERDQFRRFYSERRNVMDPSLPDLNLTTGDQFTTSSWNFLKPAHTIDAIAGYFGRVNYDYQGKYLFEFNARYDGSSKFPRTDLWAFFPSGSIGYRITEESFMEGVKDIFNDIKIRASIGSIGNQNIRANVFRQMMASSNSNWILGNAMAPTVGTPTIVDPTLSWEKITTYDIGADVRFLNNMFGITFDWYTRYTKDMLAAGKELPQTIGTGAPFTNAGEMRTRGYEIALDFNLPINKDMMVYANFMLSDYQQEITKWDNPAKLLGNMYEGMKVGEIWGFETDRLFQITDFHGYADGENVPLPGIPDQSQLLTGSFKAFGPGDVKYVDLNKDGIISAGDKTVDNPGDLKVIGNTTPRYEYSFRLGGNFYGFDLDVFFQGVGKRDYWATSDLILPLYNRTDALYGQHMDYWTKTNPDAYWPSPFNGHAANAIGQGVYGSNNFVTQSRYLLNMSYLRLKNLTVGYTLPVLLTKKIGIDKLRVYFSAQNLAEFKSSRMPLDPEINDTEAQWGRTFPYPRTFSMGLQVNF